MKKLIVPAAYVAFIVLAGIGVASFFASARDGELRRRCTATCLLHPEYAGVNRAAPDFELPNLNGKNVRLSDYRGKVVVLNFWNTTCPPCREEMPDLAELAKVLEGRHDVAFLTVSNDEGAEVVKNLLQALFRTDQVPFEVLLDPDSKVVSGKFGTHLVPETWILDARGVIRARFDGTRPWTNAVVVEYIDHVRGGGYCPIEIEDGQRHGEGAKLCQDRRIVTRGAALA